MKGIPVLFIPGNAGSYKQVRPLAAEAAVHFQDTLSQDPAALKAGKRPLDFFSVDFNEDITAFHGQTLLDQAEYLNEAVAYILSLYHNPSRSLRDSDLPDPSSVVLVGHSMGGMVARTMLTMPNYQANSINTIVTLSAPHARAPVSFDAESVHTYERVNTYWRDAYSQRWANNNPLWHVTTISIAGGGLDTVVPSDYSTMASLVPSTHGFTVFTSTIPRVWTGMDHLAITWCDQLRKSVVRALYDVVDANRPNQTRPRAERMKSFKKWFLTGMEDLAERDLRQQEPETLLILEDQSNSVVSQGERVVLRSFGQAGKQKAYLLPIPPHATPDRKRFTLMTDQKLSTSEEKTALEVLVCSVFPLLGQSQQMRPLDLSEDGSGSTRLACKNAASDRLLLPASTSSSQFPFDEASPMSYLQYDLEELADHQFVAIVDTADHPATGWAVAEFASKSESTVLTGGVASNLVFSALEVAFPAERALVNEIKIPSVSSSLLAYRLSIQRSPCTTGEELFAPLLRQHIADPYESKFFVNVEDADISMHGLAPYMPPSLHGRSGNQGLALQIWTDPSCANTVEVYMKVDLLGSLGKLWMRYRTVFAAFPLLVVALVLRRQFRVYDESGTFISFSESMDQCLRRSIPVLLVGLSILALSFSSAGEAMKQSDAPDMLSWAAGATGQAVDYARNDLLLGSQDPFFWFLLPLFGVISIGVCIATNYAVLLITYIFATVYTFITARFWRAPSGFAQSSLRQRVITTGFLLLLVSTIIPYQFVFIVLCVVQIVTCVRALSVARESRGSSNINFYNYVHSILLLLLWILPINLPVLVVWVHNLAVHWLTPFSSHHNVLAIMPYVLLIETLSTGNMVPRVHAWIRPLTALLLSGLAVYAAVYGVTFAYRLHWIVNVICTWLVGLHFWGYSQDAGGLQRFADMVHPHGPQDVKKRP